MIKPVTIAAFASLALLGGCGKSKEQPAADTTATAPAATTAAAPAATDPAATATEGTTTGDAAAAAEPAMHDGAVAEAPDAAQGDPTKLRAQSQTGSTPGSGN